jgi:hydroxymethylglutaryl-CoA reductase
MKSTSYTDEFIENTITNFYIPLESPYFLINGNTGRFRWQSKKALLSLASNSSPMIRGGFKATVLNTGKLVKYTLYLRRYFELELFFVQTKAKLLHRPNTQKHAKTGGGILTLSSMIKQTCFPIIQLHATFDKRYG